MSGDRPSRYDSTEQFLAELDRIDGRRVALDEQAYGHPDDEALAPHAVIVDDTSHGDRRTWDRGAELADGHDASAIDGPTVGEDAYDRYDDPYPDDADGYYWGDPHLGDDAAFHDDPDGAAPGAVGWLPPAGPIGDLHADDDHADVVADDEPPAVVGDDTDPTDTEELDGLADPPATDDPQLPSPRLHRPVVVGFLAAVGAVTLGVTAAMIGLQSHGPGADETTPPTHPPPAAPAAPTANAPLPAPTQDAPIPFQASSPCPQAGSGSAQNVAGDDPTRAWVCMRDADGQVMTLDLGTPMKVTAIVLTPGWVGTDASGTDQWSSHRVVTRAQWILVNGADRTVITQDTHDAHGPVPVTMPGNGADQGVLASRIQMVILQTSRPPADPTPAPTGTPDGGPLGGLFGGPVTGADPSATPNPDPAFGGPDADADPVDDTVAISAIHVLGHPPR